MRLPKDITFLFVCPIHDMILSGDLPHGPKLKHPNAEARAVWEFDLTDMRCPGWNSGVENPDNGFIAECRPMWEARA